MLILFDIDGTLLLRTFVEHRHALTRAVRETWGVEDPGPTAVGGAGRTDWEIVREICLLGGVSAERFDDGLPAFVAACGRIYAQDGPPDLRGHVAPGVPDALAVLAARPGVVLSLVTGNLEAVARLKLERSGLGGFFAARQGAFGSDAEDRADLPRLARRRAGADGAPYPRSRTVVVGDTPNDIACARADGVRCVAVTTGPFDAAALARADAVIAGLGELPAVLDGRG